MICGDDVLYLGRHTEVHFTLFAFHLDHFPQFKGTLSLSWQFTVVQAVINF